MPLVSVVVPTHNRASLLDRALAAVCGQTSVDFEVIVVDDGSTEDISAITSKYEHVVVRRNDSRLGVSVARNCGIAAASGDWVAFCDDDDIWAPDKLSAQLAAAQEAGAGWVYAGDVNVDDSLRVLSGSPPPNPEEVLKYLKRWNPLSSGGSNVMVRADVLAATGGFDANLRRTEDWDLWLRLAMTGPPAWVRRPLVAYRFHAQNVMGDLDSIVTEPRLLAARYGIPVDLAAMHRRAAWTALRRGGRREALAHYARAIAHGDLTSLARAAVACAHPILGANTLFVLQHRDNAWVTEAEQWLSVSRPMSGTKFPRLAAQNPWLP